MAGVLSFNSLITGFSMPFVLKAVIEHGILEILARSDRALTSSEVASEIEESNSDIVKRLLNYLVEKKLLDEASPGCFSLNAHSRCLLMENKPSMAPVIKWMTSDPMIASWQALQSLVVGTKPGEEPSPFSLATNSSGLFEYLARDAAFGKIFVSGLHAAFIPFSVASMRAVMENYDGFKSIGKVLVDCGGGNGACSGMIAEAYPNLRVINFDLPLPLKIAKTTPGVEHVAGDMFRSVPSGDAIFIKQVLHNWNDEKCKLILKNIHKALPDKGKLIIVDMFEPVADMDMLMLLMGAGKERSKDEWVDLLTSEGFSGFKFITLPNVTEGIIEAFKA